MLRLLRRSWRRIVGYFMAGLLAVLPVMLTVIIVVWVTNFLKDILGPDTFLGKMLAGVGMRFGSQGIVSYLVGIGLVLVAIFALGLLVEWGAKKFLQELLDKLLEKVPIVGSLYGSIKQLVGMFDRTDETKLKAMSVVYCYFGGRGNSGVLALMPSPEVISFNGRDYHVVIIPTSPIPFGGGLVFFPVEDVEPVEMSVDNLISIYVSMGVTTPEFMKKANLQRNTPQIDS